MDLTDLVDLAAERLGGSVLAANDEFFAPKEQLLDPAPPVFIDGKYTDRGKWMDGWETRRRREPGYDWCIIRLGAAGRVRGVVVDTSFFRGNYPAECSIQGCEIEGYPSTAEVLDRSDWKGVLPRVGLAGDTQNRFAVDAPSRVTHLRFNIFPDGGVARLRTYGDVLPDWPRLLRRPEIDLAAVEHGGLVLACSDMFFGPRHNLIMPGLARDMSDGWETRRRRVPGHDWVIVRLGAPGTLHRIEVDTSHYKGNAPGSCWLEATRTDDYSADALTDAIRASLVWQDVLARTPLLPHTRHVFEDVRPADATHVRFNIHPEGGVARLRLFGSVAPGFAAPPGPPAGTPAPPDQANSPW